MVKLLACAALLVFPVIGLAQISEEEHLSHHPEEAAKKAAPGSEEEAGA